MNLAGYAFAAGVTTAPKPAMRTWQVEWDGMDIPWTIVARTVTAVRNKVRMMRADSELPEGTRITEVER